MTKKLFKYIYIMRDALLAILILVSTGCGTNGNDTYTTIDGFAQGTTFRITYLDPQGRDLSGEFAQFFDDFDNSLSIYNPSSIVSRLNDNDTTATPDDLFIECFNLSQSVSLKSGGLFDVTLRPLISAYGFGGEDSHKLLSQKQIDSMLQFVGYDKVRIDGNRLIKKDSRTELDFNAIAKGYSVDLLGSLLDSLNIENYLVEVGGEIVTKGKNSKAVDWTIAIDTPYEGNFTPGKDTKATLMMSGAGLATSGNYRKFAINDQGEKVVHTVDPRSGKPAVHTLLSATIVAPTCAIADGFATACMVAGLDGAQKIVAENPELEALFIYAEGDQMLIYATDKMKKRIIQSN